jgi:hypothetical protein
MKNHNKNFVVFWILVLLSCVLVSLTSSCASRKVIVDKTDIKKDSIVETKVKVIVTETEKKSDSTNIFITNENSELTITPIDTTKEIIVNGVSYKNAILNVKKNKTNVSYSNKNKTSYTKSKDSTSTNKVVKTEVIKTKEKKIDKKQNYLWINLLLILLLTIYIIWQNRQWLLKKLL